MSRERNEVSTEDDTMHENVSDKNAFSICNTQVATCEECISTLIESISWKVNVILRVLEKAAQQKVPVQQSFESTTDLTYSRQSTRQFNRTKTRAHIPICTNKVTTIDSIPFTTLQASNGSKGNYSNSSECSTDTVSMKFEEFSQAEIGWIGGM
ncbi:hypothetical protein TNCV_4960651 [Trichonephila clavipes]|uniref:Uncharacterized protein n=1 Tax=Trichonephila clavipes TaxID=2585209 RepID=A0A8X6SLW4_TRICX|nr:hypothetical protein TNCV_4960651 [Trichonephila clavipes]